MLIFLGATFDYESWLRHCLLGPGRREKSRVNPLILSWMAYLERVSEKNSRGACKSTQKVLLVIKRKKKKKEEKKLIQQPRPCSGCTMYQLIFHFPFEMVHIFDTKKGVSPQWAKDLIHLFEPNCLYESRVQTREKEERGKGWWLEGSSFYVWRKFPHSSWWSYPLCNLQLHYCWFGLLEGDVGCCHVASLAQDATSRKNVMLMRASNYWNVPGVPYAALPTWYSQLLMWRRIIR